MLFSLIIKDMDEAKGKDTVAEIEKNGGESFFVKTNVVSEAGIIHDPYYYLILTLLFRSKASH